MTQGSGWGNKAKQMILGQVKLGKNLLSAAITKDTCNYLLVHARVIVNYGLLSGYDVLIDLAVLPSIQL